MFIFKIINKDIHSGSLKMCNSYFLFISLSFCNIGVSSILEATLVDDPVALSLSVSESTLLPAPTSGDSSF